MTVHSCCISHSLRITRKGCIHAIPPSCQFRGPTFIPCQGDPTTMPALLVLRHRNRSCKNRVPPRPTISPPIHYFPGKFAHGLCFFFWRKGSTLRKHLKRDSGAARSYLCAHAVLQSYLKASCVCSFFSGGLGVVEVEDGFAVRAGAKLYPGRARRQLTSSVVSIRQQTAGAKLYPGREG